MTVLGACSAAAALAGVLAFVVVAVGTRDLRVAASCALELWAASGLLHLATDAEWPALGGAALVVAVRKLASAALGRGALVRTA